MLRSLDFCTLGPNDLLDSPGCARQHSSMPDLICFDCETAPFTLEFNRATGRDRLRLAPELRLCCTFDGETWRDFWPAQAIDLVTYLGSAHTLLSFNGVQFDALVLRRHAGLKGKLPRSGRHFDLCAERFIRGTPTTLDDLARENLNERKLVKGDKMSEVKGPALVDACRSDVWQTWRLWELWQRNELRMPPRRKRVVEIDEPFDIGPGHHAPEMPVCPNCGDVNSLALLDMDESEMSEGQASDYEAGVWGTLHCRTCFAEFDYGF